MTVAFDPANKSASVDLTNSDLTATKNTSDSTSASSTATLQSTGKYYYELTVGNQTGTAAKTVGFGAATFDNTTIPGANSNAGRGIGWDFSGIAFWDSANFVSGTAWAVGNVLGLAIDLDAHTVSLYINNVLDISLTGIPSAALRPVAMPGNVSPNAVTANFGPSFTYTPPTGYVAWTAGAGPNTATVDITVPAARLFSYPAGTLVGLFSFPAPTLSAFAYPPYIITASLPIPPLKLAAASFLTVFLDGEIALPAPQVAASGTNGSLITALLSVPALRLAVAENNPLVIGGAFVVPVPRITAFGYSGNIMSAALNIAPITLASLEYAAGTISAMLVLPPPRASSYMSAAILNAYRTWVLNTRKNALSEYGPEFAFNSFTVFNNQILAAGPSGLVVLGLQSLDNATPITARAKTGQEGFGTSYHKRVPRIYVSGTFRGDVLFRTITSEGGPRTYKLVYNNGVLLQQRRIPVGKGPRSRFWQFEIENVAGADFSINDILVYPTVLKRRVE